MALYELGIDSDFYLKIAEIFPNKDDLTSINFLSFIGIVGRYAPDKIKFPFFNILFLFVCTKTKHSISYNIS